MFGWNQTNTQTLHWFKLRELILKKKLSGIWGRNWHTFTRLTLRRTVHTIVAFGERSADLMVTVVLFVLSSSPTFLQSLWYDMFCNSPLFYLNCACIFLVKCLFFWSYCLRVTKSESLCTPATFKVLVASICDV